ncbi:MAG: hypothetical protein R2770_18305 [Acidimicrobiales bacterium]
MTSNADKGLQAEQESPGSGTVSLVRSDFTSNGTATDLTGIADFTTPGSNL